MKNSKKSKQNSDIDYAKLSKNSSSPMQDQDFMHIQNLVQLAKKNDISELSFERDDYKLTIKRNLSCNPPVSTAPPILPQPIPANPPQAPSPQISSNLATSDNSISEKPIVSDDLHTIKCPIPGTFYRRPSPDKPYFVQVGDTVKVGDILCTVEAMKLFNNIECDMAGKIVDILVEDGSPVEFDQPLFALSKS